MHITKMSILAATLVLAACGGAQASPQSATGCPTGAWTTWNGTSVSISWSFTNVPAVVAFYPNGVVYAGVIASLDPAQAAVYAPTLNDLRAAAAANRKVTIYWDNATKVVSAFVVRWNQPC